MAQDLAVKLVITGDATNLQDQLRQVASQLSAINGGGGSGGMGSMFDGATKGAETFQQSLRGLIGRFSALWAVMKSGEGIATVFNQGIKYNQVLEDSRLGIGALITAQAKLADVNGNALDAQGSLNAAMGHGNDQIQKLRISGLQTAATTEQLVSAYQDAVGGGLRANMSLDQIRILTVQTVQAAGAMGVPMNQLNQEIRSILDGTIDRNSRVAIRLGITNADVAKWKSAGTLFEELNKRMDAFTEAGKESMKNWSVLLSNMVEASQILLGDAFKAPMKNIQGALNAVMETIVDINTANISDKIQPVASLLRDLGNVLGDFAVGTINAISNAVLSMGQWWAANRDALLSVIAAFKVFLADAFSFVGTVGKSMITLLSMMAMWFMGLPEPIKAASVAAGAFAIAMWTVNSAMAGGIATGLGSLISGLQRVGMVFAVATTGATGFSAALTAAGGPWVWAIAAVAALAAGVYYLSTAGERAAQTQLELARKTSETTTAMVQLSPLLKDIDEKMKSKKLTEEQKIERDAQAKKAIEDLIKLAPDQEAIINEQIASGMKYNDVLKEQLKLRLMNLMTTIEEEGAKLKAQQEESAEKARNPGALRTTLWTLAGRPEMAWIAAIRAGEEEYQTRLKTLEVLKAEYKTIADKLDLEEKLGSITANKVIDEKKLKEMEKHRHDMRVIDLQIQAMEIAAMPHRTAEEKKFWDLRKAGHALDVELERIGHSTEDVTVKERQRMAAHKAYAQQTDQIDEDFREKGLRAQDDWNAYMEKQEGDTLQRKLAALDDEVRRKIRGLRDLGAVITEEDEKNVLIERRERETVAFREQRYKQLEQALKDLERQKGVTFTFNEQMKALDDLGQKLMISGEYISGYKNRMKEISDRKADWFGGLAEGVKEVAESVTDRFKMMKDTVLSVASGMRSAFSTAIQGMLSGSMTLSQGLKSIWKGITNTIIQAVADIIAKFIVAGIANTILGGILSTTSKVTAASMYQLAVMESWAAYAGMPFIGMPLALAQIAAITATYAAVTAAGVGMGSGGASGAGSGAFSTGGLDYPALAMGGLVERPTYALIGEVPGRKELVAPETTFVEWIKTVGERAMKMPMGGFQDGSGQQLAFAGGGGTHIVQASFDGALIIGDSQEGLRKAAKQLRTIRTYDERANG